MQRVLFIDRDGTLVEEPFDFQVDSLDKIRLCSGVIPALSALMSAGFRLVMVSNQDGLGTGRFPQTNFQICHDFILALFSSQGIYFSDIFICPHTQEDNCNCRKPKPGLLDAFLLQNDIDRNNSWVIGDRETDKQLAHNIGVTYLPISPENTWPKITETLLNQQRSAVIKRQTKETSIEITLNLDAKNENCIKTPIGFFSHMLEQIAKHGGFSLQITATGDTEVDEHHLIEDTALALGEALKKALGDKWGIARYGFTLPMDESLATAVIDLGGRNYCDFSAPFTREFIGGMATEMVPHFFNSLASSLGATLHISVQGQNHHHMIEACFKALGRALRQACARCDSSLPSTKGVFMIAIIDVSGNNLTSLANAVQRLGHSYQLTHDAQELAAASHVILPGVGAAAAGMRALKQYQLTEVLQQLTQPILGICLGMQLLLEYSEEGEVACLNRIPGYAKRLAQRPDCPVPHMGWSKLIWTKETPIAQGLTADDYVYFVHSYALIQDEHAVAQCQYSEKFTAIVQYENVYGMQFHPEKSAETGLKLLNNFLQLESS